MSCCCLSEKYLVVRLPNNSRAMAEGSDPKEKGLEDLEQEITCPVCHERFRDPKMLPCLHYYCRECVRQLALRGQPFPCPECRTNTFLPQSDPDRLPTLFLVNRIKDVHAKLEKAQGGKVEAACEMCGEGKAEAFCRQCTYFICDDCTTSHRKMKVFAGHEVVKLKEGGAKHIPLQPAPPPTCKEHDELLKIYCFDCDRLICRDCLIDDHSGHKREFVKKAAPECKKMLREGLAPLRKFNADIAEANKQVEVVKTKISGQSASVTNTIRQSFNRLHEILYQREQELLGKTSELVEKKLGTLNAQQKTFQTATAEFLSLSDFVERNLESATDEELVSLHKPILARLEDEGKKHSQISLEPAEVSSISVYTYSAEDLSQLFQQKTKPSCCSIADSSKFLTMAGSGFRTAEVDKSAQCTVSVAYPHGEVGTPLVVKANVRSLVVGSVVQCTVTEKEGGVYEVSYTPKTRGRHSLTVTVNGKEITGSPFRVFVKIHPTQLDKPVRTITGIERPWGIAINSKQQLLVAEYLANKVAELNQQGKRLRTIQHYRFIGLSGVATDKDDNVYVTDYKVHTLLKFNKDGKLLKTVGRQGKGHRQFDWPGMIEIIDDQLYVCDRHNHRIQILNLDLQFVGRFGSKGSGNGQFGFPQDLVQDGRGNLYVTDDLNDRVQVFDRDGNFLRAFAEKGSSWEELNRPIGLCFDSNQFLFVTERFGECVSVFKPTGEFMTSFGHNIMSSPAGIVIDEDVFVYVCDYGSGCNRIFVF